MLTTEAEKALDVALAAKRVLGTRGVNVRSRIDM